MIGRIFSYAFSRGFGFITPDDHGPQIFFHRENVKGNEILLDGTYVSYELVPDWTKPGKFRAGQITKLHKKKKKKNIKEERLPKQEEERSKECLEHEQELHLRRKNLQDERISSLPIHRRVLDDPEHIRVHGLDKEFVEL